MLSDKLNTKVAILFSIAYSVLIVGLCLSFNPHFFNVDDAINEMLGFYKQYGRIWAEGNIPFIVDTMFVGGNGMIELGKAIFLPQTIIASLLTYHFNIRVPGIFLALCNIFLIAFSSIIIAKRFNISNLYAYGVAVFVVIQPIFLYQYAAGWWNAANGQAWATVAIATFLLLNDKFSIKFILLNFISVIFLLASGWPHGVIGYAVCVAAVLIYQLIQKKTLVSIILLALPSLLALIFAVPIYSEYILSSDALSRATGFNNYGDFLSLQWSSIIMGFNPSFYEFMHYFGGYRLVLIPLAFSTVLIPMALFYRDFFELVKKDVILKLLLVFCLVFFLLTQTSSQLGALRWSFRFLPFLSLFIVLSVMYILDKGAVAKKNIFYIVFILIGFFLSINVSSGEDGKYLIIQLLSMLFLFLIPYFLLSSSVYKLSIIGIFSLVIMLLGTSTLGGMYVFFAELPQRVHVPNANFNGFLLSFTDLRNSKKELVDLNSSQFGIYDIKSINGYSPVGNLRLEKLLPYPTAHSVFDINNTLNNILSRGESQSGVCVSNFLRISSIVMPQVNYENYYNKLIDCGYTEKLNVNNDVFVSLPRNKTLNWNMLPPSVFPEIEYQVLKHTNNMDEIKLGKRKEQITLIFPRVWWHGYSAELNGKNIPVSTDATGVLVKVTVQEGDEAVLTLSYFPRTWRSLWILPLFSLFGIFVLIFLIRTKRNLMTSTV